MRILFVASCLGFGGAERVISILSKGFVSKGHEVGIYLTNPDSVSAYVIDSRVTIFSCKTQGKFNLLKDLRKNVKDYDPDIVVPFLTYQCIYTVFALLGTKYPVVVCERSDPYVIHNNSKIRFIARDISFWLANGAVFQTEGARDYFHKSVAKKSCVIYNPIDISSLPSEYSQERTDRIVTVGRLTKYKNQVMLISAFAKIKDEFPTTVLEFYGDGDEKDNLVECSKQYGVFDRVFFMGNVTNVYELIKDAKIFAFTSDHEGMPNALAEAMSIGIPCVSTDCSPGGARALIQNGYNGIIVPVNDPIAFSEALRMLLLDDDMAKELGKNAVQLRDKLNIDTIVNRWEEYFLKVISFR